VSTHIHIWLIIRIHIHIQTHTHIHSFWYHNTAGAAESEWPTFFDFGSGSESHVRMAGKVKTDELAFGIKGSSAMVWLDLGAGTFGRNEWHHVAVVVKKSTTAGKAEVRVYQNEVLLKSSTDNTMPYPSNMVNEQRLDWGCHCACW
jgi:hypothetical protein